MTMAFALWFLFLATFIANGHGQDENEAFRFFVGEEEPSQVRRGDSVRRLSSDQFDRAYSNPAFARCWDTLNEVSNEENEVTRSAYLEFLRLMSYGEIDETQFGGLSLGYVTMFLSAACRPDRSCEGGAPSILVDNESDSVMPIISLCYTLMRDIVTVATFDFSVSVEFDPDTVVDITQCLESAAETVLANSYGYEIQQTGTSRMLKLSSEEESIPQSLPQLKDEVVRRIRNFDYVPQRSLNGVVDCPYDISAERITSTFGRKLQDVLQSGNLQIRRNMQELTLFCCCSYLDSLSS